MDRMKIRPLRLAAGLAAASLPLALLGLGSAGHADTTPPLPNPPPPGPGPINPNDTVAWEKARCTPTNPVVTLPQPANVAVTVIVDTVDGTAVAPYDYLAIRGLKVTIPAGSLSAEIPITIVADDITESDESFLVKISSPSVGWIGKDTAVVIIKDGVQPAPCNKT
jgi:hypothetical protein